MPQEFESVYRIVGIGDEGRRVALYDIPRDDTVWVNALGYDDDINSVLQEVETGNVVEAVVTDAGDENEYWNFLDIALRDDTVLYYVSTSGYTPGPVDQFWENRDPGVEYVTAGRRDNETNEVLYEVQMYDKEIETENGEVLDVYTEIQRGDLLTEPMFEGSGCEYLQNGAEALIIVKPDGADYLVFYLFPEQNEKFKDIWGALYDEVINN